MRSRRIIMSLLGVIIVAVNVGLLKIAALGVDPFQSLMSGLIRIFPISYGTLFVIVGALMLIFALLADRQYIGIATFINLFLLGYIIQFTYDFLLLVMPNPSLFVRVLCLIVAIVAICLGSSLYITANMGVSTYDAVALILANKYKLGPFRFMRIGTDLACVLLGGTLFLIGGGALSEIPTIIGIGTIVTALFMGPLIELLNKKISEPLLVLGKTEL